jgi:hypothetical protein
MNMPKRSKAKKSQVSSEQEKKAELDAFLSLRGIARDVFAELGGGEACIRAEREAFSAAMDERERERKKDRSGTKKHKVSKGDSLGTRAPRSDRIEVVVSGG